MSAKENKPGGEVILYQTEDLQTRLEVRLEGETVWLTQAQMTSLFNPKRSAPAPIHWPGRISPAA